MRKEKKKKKVRKYAIVKTLDPWNRTGEKRKPGEGRSTVETANRRIQRRSHDRVRKKKEERKEKKLGSDRRANERARSRHSLSKPPFVSTNTIVESRHHPPRSRVKGHDEEKRRTLFLLFLPSPSTLPFLFYVARGLRAAWREHTREDEVRDVDDDDENDGNDNGQREEKRAWPDKETNF